MKCSNSQLQSSAIVDQLLEFYSGKSFTPLTTPVKRSPLRSPAKRNLVTPKGLTPGRTPRNSTVRRGRKTVLRTPARVRAQREQDEAEYVFLVQTVKYPDKPFLSLAGNSSLKACQFVLLQDRLYIRFCNK